MATVTTAARLHFGFQNLALAHERLYGGVGVALETPTLVLRASPDTEIRCEDEAASPYVRRAVEALDTEEWGEPTRDPTEITATLRSYA